MIPLDEALDAATTLLAQSGEGWDPETMRIVHERVRIEDGHAVVPYNSRAFLDEGRKGAWLLGNPPVLVDLATGACRFMTIDEVLASPGPHGGT
ncbi:YrhB domain-containing protein [Streptomyces sp. P8-A8]|uniref:YrhB domain-containing protein n=1 Tax=Streptomyces sp. P8-A8 TaxID=3029759 RepID=UPI0036D95D5C